MRVFFTFTTLLLSLAASAEAAEPRVVTRDLTPSPSGRSPAAPAPARFTLVGIHWRGSGSVEFSTRSLRGRWSGWRPAAPEAEDAPDRLSAEARRDGWRRGNPYWVGPSDDVRVRTRGRVTRVRARLVWSEADAAPPRRLAVAGAPAIVPRLSWGANESIRRAAPRYAPALQFAVVHHTAGRTAYTRAESAAIVRGIQTYHVSGNGWNDIGYNFLVDRFGQVFEGRYGGIDRNVVGAHAEGFNTGSIGIAVIGTYGSTSISPAAEAAVAQLIAWRLDVAHVDPLSALSFLSGGNQRFPRGVPVPLRAVVGHRDTGFTDCPGGSLYARLGTIAQAAARAGGPKLFTPAVRGSVGGAVRFTGRLSASLPWTVAVADASGRTVATGTGTGTAVDWTWDASLAPSGTYTWVMGAGPSVRPATGTLGAKPAALAIRDVRADPGAITPNGDGHDDSATVSYTLTAPATVTVTLADTAGTPLATLLSEPRPAGTHTFTFGAESVADGIYRILLSAQGATGKPVTASVTVLVNRTLAAFAASRRAFSPNGDGRADEVRFTFSLTTQAQVRLQVLRGATVVATPFEGPLGAGGQKLSWDGAGVSDGAYQVDITVTDGGGTVAQRLPLVVDTLAPTVTLVTRRPLRVRMSEPGALLAFLDGRRRLVEVRRAGVVRLPGAAPRRTFRLVPWDLAGNRGAQLRRP